MNLPTPIHNLFKKHSFQPIDLSNISVESYTLSLQEIDYNLLPSNYLDDTTTKELQINFYAYENMIAYAFHSIHNGTLQKVYGLLIENELKEYIIIKKGEKECYNKLL